MILRVRFLKSGSFYYIHKVRANLTLLILFISMAARAQVCSGGLGDPIVDITFGSGTATYGPSLAPGVTGLTYEQDSCPQQGSDPGTPGGYAIVHSPGFNCYGGDWVNFTGDHTGDPNGYFMLINASTLPDNFYKQEIDGLCPSTSYQFSSWVVNMASQQGEINPDITFSIQQTDGTVLQSFDTGPVPILNPAQWNQYAFYFSTPPGISSVIISMYNNAPGGYGNDLGIDDITFRTSGPSVDISIAGHAGDTANLCPGPGNTLQLTGAVGSCYPTTAYQWQQSSGNGGSWADIPGAVNPLLNAYPTATGQYLYRLAAAQSGNIGLSACQVASSPDTIVVLPQTHPAISIQSAGGYICADSPAMFFATPVDSGTQPTYQWMIDGVPVAGGPSYSSGTLANGDQVNCTLTSNAICPVAATAVSNTITVNLLPDIVTAVSIQASANGICQDSLVIFTAIPTNGGSHPSYTWEVDGQTAGSDTPVYSSRSLNNGDVVTVVLNSGQPCSSSSTSTPVPMTVYDVPGIQLTPDTIIAPGSRIMLHPVITGAINFSQWTPATGLDDPLVLQAIASPIETTVYQLEVQNAAGCAATASEKVQVFYNLSMPNAFTPNGDGHNDLFRIPPLLNLTIERFSVYNRWGALVFTTNNSLAGWDGRMGGQAEPAGTYVWIVSYYDPLTHQTVMKKGTVELIR
jgi:gliding motility-associated-like protein